MEMQKAILLALGLLIMGINIYLIFSYDVFQAYYGIFGFAIFFSGAIIFRRGYSNKSQIGKLLLSQNSTFATLLE